MFIPLVNFIIAIILNIDIAKNFGQGVGFGIGLIFLPFIFYPILGFGSAQYQGGASAGPSTI
jgi:VIT1/CCC1 family predicted Fe2+/Mn2+ transporter